MEKFTFIFLVIIENKDADLSVAVTLLDTTIAELNQFRSHCEIAKMTLWTLLTNGV